jgi:hypothetical protein
MPQSGVYKARGAHPPMSQAPRPKPPRQTGGFLLALSAAAHPPASGPAGGLSAPTHPICLTMCGGTTRRATTRPGVEGGASVARNCRDGPVSIMMASQCQCLRNAPPRFPNDRRLRTRRCACRSPAYGAQCVRASWSLRTSDTVDLTAAFARSSLQAGAQRTLSRRRLSKARWPAIRFT